jgi:hypothetical protein
MKHSVMSYVQGCDVCQQAKSEHMKLLGLLQLLPVLHQSWAIVRLNFIEGLPKSHHHNAIMVVIDKLSMYAHFLLLAYPFTTLQVDQVYFNHIYRLHGLPHGIISECDRMSNLWQELFKLSECDRKWMGRQND